jgi:hypothetical protein
MADLLDRVVALLAAEDPAWPDDLPLAEELSAEAATRRLRVAAAWAGPCARGPVLAGDGRRETTVRLDGERLALRLTLQLDDHGVGALTLVPDE